MISEMFNNFFILAILTNKYLMMICDSDSDLNTKHI